MSARSITQYAWAIRHSSAADKSSVKFSEKAVLSQTVEVSLKTGRLCFVVRFFVELSTDGTCRSSAADKSSVKFSEKAVLSQTVEVSLETGWR
jgi:hypothetical protein